MFKTLSVNIKEQNRRYFRKLHIVYLLIIMVLALSNGHAQNTPNIAITKSGPLLIKLRGLRRNASADSALKFANYVIEQAKTNKDRNLETEAYYELGRIYFLKDDQIKSLETIRYAESISKPTDNSYYSSPQMIGFILNRQGKADEALQYLFLALKRAEDANYTTMILATNFALADAYRENKNSGKGVGYALKGLEMSIALKDTGNILMAYSTLGNLFSNREYVNEQRLETAVAYYEKIMQPPFINSPRWTQPYDSAKHFSNMGRLYRMQKKFELSKKYLDIALDVTKRRGFKSLEQSILNEQLTLELDKGNKEKAVTLAAEAKRILPANQTSLVRVKELEERAQEANTDIGNYKEAYEHLVNADRIKDSLYSINNQAAITEVEKKYERDTKVLKATNLALKKEGERNIIVAFSLIVIMLLSGIYIWRSYKRRQQNKFLKTLVHEVNHRTKNNLQMLNSLITSVYHNVQDEPTKVEVKKLRSYIKSFGLVYDNLNRTASFDDIDIAAYTKDIGNAVITNLSDGQPEFVYQSDIPILISTDKAILLGLIINELITNSLKHAFNREVHNKIAISINKQDDKWMQVHYEDNGRGEIISTQSKKSFGIGMVQQLVKQLKGTITFEPSSPKKITISIPLS